TRAPARWAAARAGSMRSRKKKEGLQETARARILGRGLFFRLTCYLLRFSGAGDWRGASSFGPVRPAGALPLNGPLAGRLPRSGIKKAAGAAPVNWRAHYMTRGGGIQSPQFDDFFTVACPRRLLCSPCGGIGPNHVPPRFAGGWCYWALISVQ